MSGAALDALAQRREQIAVDLNKIEKQIYDTETTYFTSEYTNFGTVLKGFEGFLTSKNAMAKNKNKVFKLEDRAFSLSSVTSPATHELQAEREAAVQEAAAFGGRGKGAFNVKSYGGLPPAKGRRGY